MIQLRPSGCESWLNERWARKLSAKLGARLWERCKGHAGLFVTLTYRRDEYRDAQELYRRQSEEQHVPLFLRKIGRHLGENLSGRWFCKMEFQRGGWVHWHIIILDVEKIPHAIAKDLWGRGHVWLRRLNKSNVKYCTKYTCKGGSHPAWLLMERPRSIKIIRVSSGFWGESDADAEPEPAGDPGPEEWEGPKLRDIYVPIGERLQRDKHAFVARDEEGRYYRGRIELGQLLLALLERGCGVVENLRGWLVIDAGWEQLGHACGVAVARANARAAAALHLRRTGNPDTWWMPPYLDDWYRENAMIEVA